MKYQFTLSLLLFFLSTTLIAQEQQEKLDTIKTGANTLLFLVNLPKAKTANSLYNHIKVIDQRSDTATLGFLDVSSDNGTKIIIPGYPLHQQFSKLLTTLTDSAAGNGELLLQVNRFSFSSFIKPYSQAAYYYLRLRLYGKTGNGYSQLAFLDTSVKVNFGNIFKSNFYKRIFINCSETLTNFLTANITNSPSLLSHIYSLTDVMNIVGIEKSVIPVYISDTLKNGIYKSFISFKNQLPDTSTKYQLHFKKGKLSTVERKTTYKNESGDLVNASIEIPGETFYAIVDKGKAYIFSQSGFYSLQKREGDFYFTEQINESSDLWNITPLNGLGHQAFGGVGALVTALATLGPNKSLFEMKIDYLTGVFIPTKKIE